MRFFKVCAGIGPHFRSISHVIFEEKCWYECSSVVVHLAAIVASRVRNFFKPIIPTGRDPQ